MARSSLRGMLERTGPRAGVGRFFGEVVGELRKVTWPTREEATRLTLLVIAISFAVGAALAIIDVVFTRVFDFIIRPSP